MYMYYLYQYYSDLSENEIDDKIPEYLNDLENLKFL